jgi:hypothetical protein
MPPAHIIPYSSAKYLLMSSIFHYNASDMHRNTKVMVAIQIGTNLVADIT